MKNLLSFTLISLLVCVGCSSKSDGNGTENIAGSDITYQDQDRNDPCYQTSDCQNGLTCMGATPDQSGVCEILCSENSDCGNGFLCIDTKCEATCAGQNEKCSDTRPCCFQDDNNDKQTDLMCSTAEDDTDVRCRIMLSETLIEEAEGSSIFDEEAIEEESDKKAGDFVAEDTELQNDNTELLLNEAPDPDDAHEEEGSMQNGMNTAESAHTMPDPTDGR